MKVKIIRAGKPTFWYAAHVGATVEVVDKHRYDYTLKEDWERGDDAPWRHIFKADCVILSENEAEGGDKDGYSE